MAKKLKIGIIGCGGIAVAHAGGWQACGDEIFAVFDTNEQRAADFAKQFGAQVMPNLTALFESGVDAVSITTPPVAHAACALEALKRNIHVLLEKPFTMNPEEAAMVVEAEKNSQAKLMTAFRHRFLPVNRKIKELIDSGELGNIVFFFNHFFGSNEAFASDWHSKKEIAGGGAAMDVATHSVDLFRFFFGDIAAKDMVASYHFGNPVEDNAMIQLKSQSGVLGQITVGWCAGVGSDKVEVIGDKAKALYDYTVINELKVFRKGQQEPEVLEFPVTWGFPEQIQAFHDAIVNNTDVPITAQDGATNLNDIMSLYAKMA